jgi:hypothetical protein
MIWWIDLAVVLVALAALVVVGLTVWGAIRRFLRELRLTREQLTAMASRAPRTSSGRTS